MINSLKSFVGKWRSGFHRDPVRDWLMLLTIGAIAFMSIVVWNVWAFDTVAQGGVIGAHATSTPSAFNQTSLDAIHAVFEKRATEESKYVTGVYRFNDPSQ